MPAPAANSRMSPETLAAREAKQASDIARRQRHIALLATTSDDELYEARRLANIVLDAWLESNACGLYYINQWRAIVNAESMLTAFMDLDIKVGCALATNSPFFHGYVDGKLVADAIHAAH